MILLMLITQLTLHHHLFISSLTSVSLPSSPPVPLFGSKIVEKKLILCCPFSAFCLLGGMLINIMVPKPNSIVGHHLDLNCLLNAVLICYSGFGDGPSILLVLTNQTKK